MPCPFSKRQKGVYRRHPTNHGSGRTLSCVRGFSRPLRDRARPAHGLNALERGSGNKRSTTASLREAGTGLLPWWEHNFGGALPRVRFSAQRRDDNGDQGDRRTGPHQRPHQRPTADPQDFRKRARNFRNAQSDRSSARKLRAVPSLGPDGGLCVGAREDASLRVPDRGLRRHRAPRLRSLRARGPEVRHGRVPPARPDLRRADARHASPDDLRDRSRDRGQVGDRYQGAGRLHGRHAAHDGERHLHHQRHRAGDRQPDAPQPWRAVRP